MIARLGTAGETSTASSCRRPPHAVSARTACTLVAAIAARSVLLLLLLLITLLFVCARGEWGRGGLMGSAGRGSGAGVRDRQAWVRCNTGQVVSWSNKLQPKYTPSASRSLAMSSSSSSVPGQGGTHHGVGVRREGLVGGMRIECMWEGASAVETVAAGQQQEQRQ